jgi:Flp pilus assembly protein TadB
MMRNRWDPASVVSGRWASPNAGSDLRVSDAERNEVADKLSRHFAEGRLDQAEFKERLDSAMTAKTQRDLTGLFDDLPRLGTEPVPPPSRRRRLIPFLLIMALVVVAAGSTLSMVNVLHVPWLLFVIVGLFLWVRVGRHHRYRYSHSHSHSIEH